MDKKTLLIISFILVFFYVSYFFIQSQTEENIHSSLIQESLERQESEINRISSLISSELLFLTIELEEIANSNIINSSDFDKKELTVFLQKHLEKLNRIENVDALTIADKDSIIVSRVSHTSTTDLVGRDVSDRPHFKEVKQTLKPVYTNGFEGLDGIYRIGMLHPIVDKDEGFRGTVSIVFSAKDFFERFGHSGKIETQFMIVFGNDYRAIIHPDKDLLGEDFFGEKFQKSLNHDQKINEFVTNLFEGTTSSGIIESDIFGQRIATSNLIQVEIETQYYLVLVTDSDLIFSNIQLVLLQNNIFLLSLLIGITITVIIIFIISRKQVTTELQLTGLEEQLAIQSNLRRALDESSYVAITDKNGIITDVNAKFCQSSKYTREELIGQNHRILKSGYHSPEYYKNMWDTITSGKVWHDQILNKAKDETFYWNDMVIVPFLDKNNKIEEYVSIRRDITERIKLHEEKLKNEKMVTIGKLSSRLAHDLRNPLSIIRASLENLKVLYGTDVAKLKQFDKVDRSIDRITHQVSEVLDFVKGEPSELNRVKMSEIIAESIDSLVIPDNIKLIIPKNDVELLCDKKQFSAALNNLILNGIQAIDGTGTIEITVEENDNEIIIQVKDSGKGIPKEHLEQVFEPLFTTKMQGTGLGLVSVKSTVDAHGGIISVTSPPTIFTITLPKIVD